MQSRRELIWSGLKLVIYAGAVQLVPAAPAEASQGDASPWMDDSMTAHLKRVLELSDPEWDAVAPRMDKVLMLVYQREWIAGRRRIPKPSPDGQPRDVSSGGAIIALRIDSSRMAETGTATAEMAENYMKLIALASQPTPFASELKDAMEKFRTARAKSAEDLTKARESLRELMSMKQEAALVVLGILD